MGRYLSWADRRHLIAAAVADEVKNGRWPAVDAGNPTPLEKERLRSIAISAVARAAIRSSVFKGYYKLPKKNPFLPIVILTAFVVGLAVCAFAFALTLDPATEDHRYALFAASGAVAVAAIGWAVAGTLSHRNAVVQHTISIVAGRFLNTTFTDKAQLFHGHFGFDVQPQIGRDEMAKLRSKTAGGNGAAENLKVYQAVVYILNYLEFIAMGVIKGDLDEEIVRRSLRGSVIFYFDKCEPFIRDANKASPTTMEHLIRLRDSYREP